MGKVFAAQRTPSGKKKPRIKGRHPFRPRYSAYLEGYVVKFVRRSWPSMRNVYEFEDLLQEAYLVFLRCKRRFKPYGNNHAALFTAYYKQALFAHFASLATRAPRYNYVELEEHMQDHSFEDPGLIVEYTTLLQRLPGEMQEVLELLTEGIRSHSHKAANALREAIKNGEVPKCLQPNRA